MLKIARSRPWVCNSCLRRVAQIQQRKVTTDSIVGKIPQLLRRLVSTLPSTAANAEEPRSSPPPAPPPPRITPADHFTSQTHDDSLLRKIFDCPQAWHDFSSRSAKFPTQNAGLFRNAYLKDPDGFLHFAHASLAKARAIVKRVLAARTAAEYRTIVRDLDRLSDLLCRVIDMSDFVRVTHPEAKIQDAASEAWSLAYQYMNQLNTTTGLNEQLGRALSDPEVTKAWSEEEIAVAKMLKLDFMKSAVNLPQSSRDRFVDLSQRISEIGSEFVGDMAPEQARLALPSSRFQGMDPVAARNLTKRGTLYLPTMSAEAGAALRTVHDEDTRKQIYYAMRNASRKSIHLLEELLRSRAELAELAGFESYGHMALRDRMMARSPESVNSFLLALSRNNTPLVQEEIGRLLQEKQRHLLHSSAPPAASTTLNPWDRDYYMHRIRESARSRQKQEDFLSSYFSVGRVMQGLSRLFTKLYGLRLVPRETLPGEKWHPDVRRLDVVSDTEGHVAVLYCDLFYRGDKSPNPAHFTVRCSREISESEVAEEAARMDSGERSVVGGSNSPDFESAEAAANDGMAVSRGSGFGGGGGVLKQLPTVALVCDFPQSDVGDGLGGSADSPAFLTFSQVETLFHEMGHAVQSFLARTSFQNVAGTRCATDLAELPSTLMEHFAADPSVLALFARHHETDEPLDYALVAARMRQARAFEGSDTESQVVMALLDQAYHSARVPSSSSSSSSAAAPGGGGFDSTAVYHAVQRRHGRLPPDPPGTRWQGFFGHLFGYGATYYSYLFDQVLAERCWKVVFGSGRDGAALSRERGEHLKESLLRWGGSRDPWRCVSDALGDRRIAGGDEAAMGIVGSWGNKHGGKGEVLK